MELLSLVSQVLMTLIIQQLQSYMVRHYYQYYSQVSVYYYYSMMFSILLLAVTGVFPDGNIIYFEENQPFVALNWFIYHPPDHDDPGVKIRYNQQILTDATVKLDESKYQSFQDSSFHCDSASSGDSTTYYSLFVISPTISSEGEYVLIVDTYSATITLGNIITIIVSLCGHHIGTDSSMRWLESSQAHVVLWNL